MLKKIFTIAMIAGLLSSCKPSPKEGADGYVFGTPQYEKQQVLVKIVTYDSPKQLQTVAAKYREYDPNIVAFSVLYGPSFDTCTIHMVKPKVQYDPEFIGHEFVHCVYGQWHTDNKSRS